MPELILQSLGKHRYRLELFFRKPSGFFDDSVKIIYSFYRGRANGICKPKEFEVHISVFRTEFLRVEKANRVNFYARFLFGFAGRAFLDAFIFIIPSTAGSVPKVSSFIPY